MLVLAIDTSGGSGGVALGQGDAHAFSILQSRAVAGGTFSAQLVPEIAAILAEGKLKPKLKLTDIDAYAVVSGPGSFTGLRIGLTAVKGLCEVVPKPIAAITMLELLAWKYASQGRNSRALVALDASRSEFYLGEYAIEGAGSEIAQTMATRISEQLMNQAELVEFAGRAAQPVLSSDASVVEYLKKHGIQAALVERPGCDSAARLGILKVTRGQTVDVEQLDADYIRRSDAEIFSKPAVPTAQPGRK